MGKKTARQICHLTIGEDGKLESVDPIRVLPATRVLFVASNEHDTRKFRIRITSIVRKDTGAASDIFVGSPGLTTDLDPGELDTFRVKLKAKSSFGGTTSLPFTTYKYTVILNEILSSGLGPDDPYDPDIDVPPS